MSDQARIAELQKKIRIAELQASIAAAEATPEPTAADGEREFSQEEEAWIQRSGKSYGMGSKFADEATFGFLKKAGSASMAALGMDGAGGVLNYEGDFSDRYDTLLDAEKEVKRRYEEANPIKSGIASVTGGVYGAGGLMKSGVTATKLMNTTAKGGKAAAKRILAGGADAAMLGGLHAAGNDKDILANAGTSGAIGTAISAVPVVGRGIANTATARRVSKSLLNKAKEFTPYNLADKSTNYMADFYRTRVGKSFFGKHAMTEQSNAVIAREEKKYATKAVERGIKSAGDFKSYIKNLYREATPKGAKPMDAFKTGDYTVNQLKSRFTTGYEKVWDKSRPASKALVARLDKIMKTDGLSADALNTFKILRKNINAHLGKPGANRLIDREIKKYGGKFAQQADNDIVKELTAEVRKNLTKKGAAAVVDLDKRYSNYLVLQSATKKALKNNGNFDENDLISSISSVGKNNASGSEPLVKSGRNLYNAVNANKDKEAELLAAHQARIAAKKAASPEAKAGTMEQLANTALLGSPMGLFGVAGAPAVLPAGVAVAKIASLPNVQRTVAGQMPWQTTGRAALRQYDRSSMAEALRTGGRAIARTAGNDVLEQ